MSKEMQSSENVPSNLEDKDLDFLVEQYQALSASRISQNESLWSAPMLFLTAQSFLITLALGGADHYYWEKAIAAFIAGIFGFLSMQVFERNRIMVVSDAEQLLDIERYLLSRGYTGFELHQKLSKRKYLKGDSVYLDMLTKKRFTFLGRGISSDMWKYGMGFSTAVAFILFVFNLLMFSNIRFLGFETFRTFIGSIDKGPVALIALIITFTLILYILNHIEPRNSILNNEQRKKVKRNFLIAVSSIVLLAIIYSYFAYQEVFPYFQSLWLCLFIVWSIIMISDAVLLYLNRKKVYVDNDGIATIILAGGRGLRLEPLIGKHAKFIVIQRDNKTLLEDTLYRNQAVSKKQIIITSQTFHDSIDKNTKINNAPSDAEKAKSNKEKSTIKHDSIDKNTKTNNAPSDAETAKSSKEKSTTKKDISKSRSLPFVLDEPCSRGTAPAIFLALKDGFIEEDRKASNAPQVDDESKEIYDPVVIVAPSDHVIGDKDSYHRTTSKACQLAKDFDNIYLFGVIPTFPSEQYGYISVGNITAPIQRIEKFKEKPTPAELRELTKTGSVLWNSGIFIARRSVFLNAYKEINWKYLSSYECGCLNEADSKRIYKSEEDVYKDSSFDKDILEKVNNLFVIPVTFDWVDVGDPQTLQSAILAGLCSIDKKLINT